MKKTIAILVGLVFSVAPAVGLAHPGNTAADGCHYCRTNCDKWGVAWNERHCHGGYSAPKTTAPVTTKPTTTSSLQTTVISAVVLKKGMSGSEVSKLQTILAKDSAIYPEGLVTGYFGPATEKAVKLFQKKNSLEQVGYVGPQTRAFLKLQGF